jgi:hypothetical protein
MKPTIDALLVEDQNNTNSFLEALNISVSKEIKQNKDIEIRNESLEAASDGNMNEKTNSILNRNFFKYLIAR